MSLKKIVLNLARTDDHPQGSADCGYEFMAPLGADGHLDHEAWQGVKDKCTVRRFWENADDEHGRLVHHRGDNWAFQYEDAPDDAPDDEEPIFRFDHHRFAEDEYISITEHDGEQRPFKIVSVSEA